MGDADYITSPTLNDQVHCLVTVIPMDKFKLGDDYCLNKMQAIREAASDMGKSSYPNKVKVGSKVGPN